MSTSQHKIIIGEIEYPLEHKLKAQGIADAYLRRIGGSIGQAIIKVAGIIETKVKMDSELSEGSGQDVEKNKTKILHAAIASYAQVDYESVFHVLWSLMLNKGNHRWLDYSRFQDIMFDLDMEKYPYYKLAEICIETLKSSLPKQVQDSLKPETGKPGEKKK